MTTAFGVCYRNKQEKRTFDSLKTNGNLANIFIVRKRRCCKQIKNVSATRVFFRKIIRNFQKKKKNVGRREN